MVLNDSHAYQPPIASTLYALQDAFLDYKETCLFRLSTTFIENLETFRRKGFQIKDTCINFIVYWQKEGSDAELKIVLPELILQKEPLTRYL